jgi:hypothetical protein
MDSGQLFRVFNEWMKRFEYVIELGESTTLNKNPLL